MPYSAEHNMQLSIHRTSSAWQHRRFMQPKAAGLAASVPAARANSVHVTCLDQLN